MRNVKKVLGLALALIMIVSVFSGCSNGGSSSGNTNGESTATAVSTGSTAGAVTAADEPYNFHFISHKLPDDTSGYGYAIKTVMDKYTAEHPKFTFEYEVVEQMNIPGKISLLIASDDLPDMFTSEAGAAMKLIIDSGSICNMEDSLVKLGYPSYDSIVNDAAITFIKGINGTPFYYLPSNQTAEGIWYNKDMYKKYGLEVPTTWAQFIANCEVLKKNGIQPLSAGGQTKWPITRWLAVTSARMLGTDSIRQASQSDGLTFRDPGFVKAAGLVQDLFKAGYFGEGFNSIDSGTGAQMFIQGKSAMTYYLTSSMCVWMDNPEINKIGFDAIGVFPVPAIDGGVDKETALSMNCLGINQAIAFGKTKFNAGTNNDFLKFFVDNFGKELWNLKMLSPYKVEPESLTQGQKVSLDLLNGVGSSHLWWEGAMNTAVTDVAQNNAQLLCEGSMTPEEYMKELADAVEAEK